MSINDIPLQRLKEVLASDMPLTIVTTEALIARLEQAEKKAADNDRLADELLADRDYWEAKLTSLVYSLATEEEVGEWSSMNDIADNLIEHIGWKVQQLEQAVARVRGVHKLEFRNKWGRECKEPDGNGGWCKECGNFQDEACPTIRALDGEQS